MRWIKPKSSTILFIKISKMISHSTAKESSTPYIIQSKRHLHLKTHTKLKRLSSLTEGSSSSTSNHKFSTNFSNTNSKVSSNKVKTHLNAEKRTLNNHQGQQLKYPKSLKYYRQNGSMNLLSMLFFQSLKNIRNLSSPTIMDS